MRLVKQDFNYSREAGQFTVEGKGAEAVADKMAEIEGVEAQEWDAEYGVFSLTFEKNVWDWASIKDHYKAAKKNA